jgi:nucleotide-binding universal stress UspA family protein
MAFRRILIGLDQSFQDSLVFRRALEQAKPHVSSILIVHCLRADHSRNDMSSGSHSRDAIGLYETLRRVQQRRVENELHRAQDTLQLYVEHAKAKGIPTQIDCRAAQPEVRICQLAEQWNADLIVLGHREQGGLRKVSFESVTQYVLQRVGCSVMVVNGVEPKQSIHEWDTVPDLRSMRSNAETIVVQPPQGGRALAHQMSSSMTNKTVMSRADKGKRF